jgi:hypothetical protein
MGVGSPPTTMLKNKPVCLQLLFGTRSPERCESWLQAL